MVSTPEKEAFIVEMGFPIELQGNGAAATWKMYIGCKEQADNTLHLSEQRAVERMLFC